MFYSLSELALATNQCQMYSADSNEASSNRTISNKNVLVAQVSNLSDPSKSRSVKHLSFKPSPSDQCQSKEYCALDLLPTAAESLFPWRRDKSYQSLGFGIWHTQTLLHNRISRFVRLVVHLSQSRIRKLLRVRRKIYFAHSLEFFFFGCSLDFSSLTFYIRSRSSKTNIQQTSHHYIQTFFLWTILISRWIRFHCWNLKLSRNGMKVYWLFIALSHLPRLLLSMYSISNKSLAGPCCLLH